MTSSPKMFRPGTLAEPMPELETATRPDTPARPDREAVARIIDNQLRGVVAYGDLIWTRLGGPSVLAWNTAGQILAIFPPADGWRSIDTAPRGVICERSPEDCCGEPDACRMPSPLDAKEGGR